MVATDSYVSAGFVLPPLPREMQKKLKDFVDTDDGLLLSNPMDLAYQYYGPVVYPAGKVVADYSGIDTLVFHLPLSMTPEAYSLPEDMANSLLDNVLRVRSETSKPMALVVSHFPTGESWQTAFNCQQKCHEAGIPVYFSVESAAKAIDLFLHYHERRDGVDG